jgi:sirohydrochlorin cobaltochelatase
LKVENADRILLKPFMIVAGNHVRKDMVGNGSGTLKTRLDNEGFTVLPVVTGLGENTAFADIFVQHAADAARDAGIELT